MKRQKPPETPGERIERAKAELAAGDPGYAAMHALIAIAELLNQWLTVDTEADDTAAINWPDNTPGGNP